MFFTITITTQTDTKQNAFKKKIKLLHAYENN